MQNDTPNRRHMELFHQMAEALGVDLENEILSGRMKLGDLTTSIERCKQCAGPSACRAWLDHARPGLETSTPSYCRNSEMLQIQRVMSHLPQE